MKRNCWVETHSSLCVSNADVTCKRDFYCLDHCSLLGVSDSFLRLRCSLRHHLGNSSRSFLSRGFVFARVSVTEPLLSVVALIATLVTIT
jgi:hypothetical protein